MSELLIRPSAPEDLAALTSIYAWNVAHGTGTFEIDAPDAVGFGYGRRLLVELLARCEATGARQMLAVIGDSANAGSIGAHRSLGFVHVGTLKAAGRKFDRWLDVVLMQKSLGFGDEASIT